MHACVHVRVIFARMVKVTFIMFYHIHRLCSNSIPTYYHAVYNCCSLLVQWAVYDSGPTTGYSGMNIYLHVSRQLAKPAAAGTLTCSK